MIPLLSIIIVTSGKSPHFLNTFQMWREQFQLASELFACGPRDLLISLGIAPKAIINYVDPEDDYPFFRINEKKFTAGLSVNSQYVYFVHDRFYPAPGFKDVLESSICKFNPDYGAADVVNRDGSFSLRELRLKQAARSLDLIDALFLPGRLTYASYDNCFSDSIAINGGQFFIRKELLHFLSRKLRWSEMEDDVLSHDLRSYKGYWISNAHLVSVVDKIDSGSFNLFWVNTKYLFYRVLCNIMHIVLLPYFRFILRSNFYYSVGTRLRKNFVICLDSHHSVSIVDPCHKIYATDFLGFSLEKFLAVCRVNSEGLFPRTLIRTFFGWLLE